MGDFVVLNHTEHSDTKSLRHGVGSGYDLCGPRSYSLLDTLTNSTPTFASHSRDTSNPNSYFINVHASDAAMVGWHSVKLVVTLVDYPGVTLSEEIKINFEEPLSSFNAESCSSGVVAWSMFGGLVFFLVISAVVLYLCRKRVTKWLYRKKITEVRNDEKSETKALA